MMSRVFFILFLVTSVVTAQTKKPVPANAKSQAKPAQQAPKKDSVAAVEEEPPIPKEFAVYTKRYKVKKEPMKLCINLVSPSNTFNHCMTDSICRDPEVSRILFQEKQGDTTYVLVYVRAFSKPENKPSCDAGKEVKLVFVRWNTQTNKAIVRLRNIESCMRNITNMSNESPDSWDGGGPLNVSYYRGGQNFVEVTFDPKQYKLGFQSSSLSD